MIHRPDIEATSRLSPHLHFGEISPAQCWHAVRAAQTAVGGKLDKAAEKFLKDKTAVAPAAKK